MFSLSLLASFFVCRVSIATVNAEWVAEQLEVDFSIGTRSLAFKIGNFELLIMRRWYGILNLLSISLE